MATYNLPAAPDGMPSDYGLTQLINQKFFGAANFGSQRELLAGSRYLLRLTYDRRVRDRHRVLQNVIEASAIPGDDIRIRLASCVGYIPGDVPIVTSTAVAAAGSRQIRVSVAGNAVLEGKLFSVGDRLYKSRTSLPIGGNRTVTLNWPLRSEVAAGTVLNFSDPTSHFVILDQAPSFPVRGFIDDQGDTEGGPIVAEFTELL